MFDKYTIEATKLAMAINIAVEAIQKFPPKDYLSEHVHQFIKVYQDTKEACLNPEARFRNLVSLKYSRNDILIFFQESSGKAVEYFWENIK